MMVRVMKIFIVGALFLLKSTGIYGQAVDEYTLKAIWLGKFSHFIDWPEKNVSNSDTLCIGIYKTDPFNGLLEAIYHNRQIEGKPVKITHIHNLEELNGIHILFIPTNNTKQINAIIPQAQQKSILLIGDSDGYAEKGIHINFFLTDELVRFEINESSIRDSGFFVSYRLLNIAKIVEPISSE